MRWRSGVMRPELLASTVFRVSASYLPASEADKPQPRRVVRHLSWPLAGIIRHIATLLRCGRVLAHGLQSWIGVGPDLGIPALQPMERSKVGVILRGVPSSSPLRLRVTQQRLAEDPHVTQGQRLPVPEAWVCDIIAACRFGHLPFYGMG